MRIAYVGNFRPGHSTETHLARTLEQLGHVVVRLQEDTHQPRTLTTALAAAESDLFLFTRTWGQTVRLDHLDWLRARGIPSVSYHLDLYLGLQRDGGIDRDPFWRTDIVLTPDGDPDCQAEFERRGIRHRHLLPGVVEDETYLAVSVKPSRDVVFVGSGPAYHNEWTYRGDLLGWLASTYGQGFQQYGGRGQPVRGYQLNRLMAGTKVHVGDSLVLGFTHRGYASDRRYETPGRGGFMIQPWIDGINDGYEDGVNTVFYRFGDFAGLKDRIDYYLTHDGEREAIRRAGHEHVKANHTYTHRLQRMFEILREEGAL